LSVWGDREAAHFQGRNVGGSGVEEERDGGWNVQRGALVFSIKENWFHKKITIFKKI